MSHPVEKETHKLVSVVVPVYNEEEVLLQFHRRLAAALATVETDVEIIYVNDSNADRTLPALHELRDADDRVAILHLSRNFGKEIAMTAGLHQTQGDAVVVIDADLQDPPELISSLIFEWQTGHRDWHSALVEFLAQ
jgi:glycosyltransferase involved in cell wall biosynthesis